jgi:hypothetical protein
VQLAPDALAQTLHAVLKKANYKEIPLLPTCCRFHCAEPRGGPFPRTCACLDTDTMVRSFGALAGMAAVALISHPAHDVPEPEVMYQNQKLSLEYQKQISEHFYFRNVSDLTQQLGLSSATIPRRWLPTTAAQPLLPDAN